MCSDEVSQSVNAGALGLGTSLSGTPPDNMLSQCSPTGSCFGESSPSGSSLSLCPSPSSASSAPPPSCLGEAFDACDGLNTGYDSDAEYSDFGDDASDASSAYGEIPRDLYYDGAAAARWSLDPYLELSRLAPIAESVAGSDASDASSEYEVVSRNLYFRGYEAARGMV
ncbi:hypothetical protein L873DRAFT_1819623 [Choiromyces venosus 120613-1]|uniref:Uncharacterized protein n=1 Tax=Choiromyces venosus 120613-1 TaxID=1336337 RepID=A0A3N4IZL1_9PEZI|nr:hypothetical protein L873DRAFT_1819623 [Choiromyces venosus 120613-1]